MKVFHVGITAPSFSSEAITKSFKDVFGEVHYFDWQFHRFNFGTEGMRSNLLLEATVYKPDLILLHFNHNSEALSLDNYKQLSEISTTITYTEDVREDISHFVNIAPIVSKMIFTNIDDVETLKSKGFNNATYLPVSYNDIWYHKQGKTIRDYGNIVFVGNNHLGNSLNFPKAQERVDMVAALKKEFGDKFQAYGIGQENKPLNPQEVVECYNNTKIAIGQNNFNRKGYQSDRCLNSMGCGCATIMEWYEGIKNDFSEIETQSWKSIDELIAMCNLYLSQDWVRQIMSDLEYKIVTENHNWKNRCEVILKLVNGNS